MEVWRSRDGSEIAVVAATWELNRKVTFESLQPEFKRNPAQAWRNYGSKVGGGIIGAIKDPNAVIAHVNQMRMDPWDYRNHKLHEYLRGRKGVRYFMHFDLSKNNDRTGIALVHREATGVVIVDFMHAIQAKPGKNIDYEELRDFVYWFHAHGFVIEMVTYDQWQSEETRQVLEKKGFKTDARSADKTPAPYDTIIDMLLNDRLDYYNHPIFLREMQQLRTNGLKYDHPKGGSKDVSDAVACATWTAINYELENPKEAPGKLRVIRPGARSRLRPNNWGEKTIFG